MTCLINEIMSLKSEQFLDHYTIRDTFNYPIGIIDNGNIWTIFQDNMYIYAGYYPEEGISFIITNEPYDNKKEKYKY